MPRGKLYPLTAASMSAHWGPGPGSGSYWYHSQYGWRLVGPIGWDPRFPLAIISRCPLVDSCSLPLERATDYLLLGSPWAPFTLTLALSLSLGLSLWGLQIHTVVCSHRTRYCRYVIQNERQDDLSFSTAVFPVVLLLVLYSPGSEAPLVLCFLLPEWDSLDLTLLI